MKPPPTRTCPDCGDPAPYTGDMKAVDGWRYLCECGYSPSDIIRAALTVDPFLMVRAITGIICLVLGVLTVTPSLMVAGGVLFVCLTVVPALQQREQTLQEWAAESARDLPNSARLSKRLESYVLDPVIEKPWDPSTVERVEAMIDECAKPAPSLADIAGPPIMSGRIQRSRLTPSVILADRAMEIINPTFHNPQPPENPYGLETDA